MKIIRNFNIISKNDASIAGGKGASLGEMTQAGISVPPGFVILADAFERFLEETDLNVEIDSILHGVNHKEIHTVENASEKIQALILEAEMPKDIAQEIKECFKKLGARYVAVRSSATAEDSASAAWAGQLESYLNTTEKNLLENVKKCWASLFTPRAIFYRFEKGLHVQKISVAVIIQKMIASETSGIAFSVHPVTQDRNQLIIEAGFGLGEAIVSGQITPDSYVVEKEPRRIIDKNINVQTRGLYRSKNGGNKWRDIPKEHGEKQVLSDKEILEFSEIILRIENHYDFPVDVEWAREKGIFYIVQSRPITTLAQMVTLDKKEQTDIVLKKFEAMNSTFGIQGIAVTKLNKNFGNNIFFPRSGYYYKDDSVTWISIKNDIVQGRNFLEEKIKADPRYFNQLIDPIFTGFGEFRSRYDEFKNQIEHLKDINAAKRWLKDFIDFASEKTSFAYITDAFAVDSEYWIKKSGLSKGDFMSVMVPTEISFSKQYEYEIAKIKVGNSKKTPKQILSEYHWVQNNYKNVDIVDLENIKRQLRKMSKTEAKDIMNEIEEKFPKGNEQAESKINNLKISKHLKNILRALRISITLQDQRKEIVLRTNSFFVHAANRLLDFYNMSNSTRQFVISTANPLWLIEKTKNDLVESCRKAKNRFLWMTNSSPISGKEAEEKFNELTFSLSVERGEKDVIYGMAAFPGKIRGRVLIVEKREDFRKVTPGTILITSMTRPEMVPIMKEAAAFVTDEGGITCHAAIVAREMKKPCIIGTKIATRVLKDGDLVEVDADTGVVRILKRASDKSQSQPD